MLFFYISLLVLSLYLHIIGNIVYYYHYVFSHKSYSNHLLFVALAIIVGVISYYLLSSCFFLIGCLTITE